MMSKLITNVRKLEILMVIPSKVIRIIKGAALAVEIIRVEWFYPSAVISS